MKFVILKRNICLVYLEALMKHICGIFLIVPPLILILTIKQDHTLNVGIIALFCYSKVLYF